MYLGRHQLGTELRIPLLCVGSTGRPVEPDEAPTVELWIGGLKVASDQMIPIDRAITTGNFTRVMYLRTLALGQYQAICRWTTGSYFGVVIHYFELIAGGNEDGAVVSMHYYERPTARFLVQQLDSGRIRPGKNPR